MRPSGDTETLGGQYGPSENNADLQGTVKGDGAAYEGGEHAGLSFSQLSLGPSTIADTHLINVYKGNAKTRASNTARKCTWKPDAICLPALHIRSMGREQKLQSEVKRALPALRNISGTGKSH